MEAEALVEAVVPVDAEVPMEAEAVVSALSGVEVGAFILTEVEAEARTGDVSLPSVHLFFESLSPTRPRLPTTT